MAVGKPAKMPTLLLLDRSLSMARMTKLPSPPPHPPPPTRFALACAVAEGLVSYLEVRLRLPSLLPAWSGWVQVVVVGGTCCRAVEADSVHALMLPAWARILRVCRRTCRSSTHL